MVGVVSCWLPLSYNMCVLKYEGVMVFFLHSQSSHEKAKNFLIERYGVCLIIWPAGKTKTKWKGYGNIHPKPPINEQPWALPGCSIVRPAKFGEHPALCDLERCIVWWCDLWPELCCLWNRGLHQVPISATISKTFVDDWKVYQVPWPHCWCYHSQDLTRNSMLRDNTNTVN